ncbi:MAG: amidase [Acidobacteria bacterium]|nr:amidase [Acidobacteriota bacterium]
MPLTCDGQLLVASTVAAVLWAATPASLQQLPPFRVEETTIAKIHDRLQAKQITCRSLVEQYLRRIEAYDKNGAAINAIVVVNPKALEVADDLDRRFAQSGITGPLHCIPVIVKDNFDTKDLPTTAGSLSLQGFVPPNDAFQVKRIRNAGAIVLAKSNMAEFAFSPYETVSSILPGYTRNPYALDRVTAGSSGGTAAAVAANFGAVGLGSDTGNSIRGPSSHQSLAGIRSTMGLTSRGGVVPLSLTADIAGPIARSVEDAVAVFQVIAGEDPDDPVTRDARAHMPVSYLASLKPEGLTGARIGVLRQAYERETTDAEVVQVFRAALTDMTRAGAQVIDPATVEGLDEMRHQQSGACAPFKSDLNGYLAAHPNAPVHSLEEIIKSGRFHPSIQRRLEQSQTAEAASDLSEGCRSRDRFRERLRTAVLKLMDDQKLDALVYPTWSNPPRLIGDLNTPHGDNSQLFSPSTGFPAINVPMGYTRGGMLPAGLTIYGRPWDEPKLFRVAYAYEQATRHRRPPSTVPPLK